ncbi:hypothetical protein RHSIM_Rhsim13G0005800 [Rhododendron simsii]|uniref:Uncharacterized protein n=1 Tax=Rhododendron simsii TaxID=118357 RepID=A0A834L3E4_RHOSS|nr:hypothetical protein RHSIM_Rhsim13G0005800 [Rhododendron simsii]
MRDEHSDSQQATPSFGHIVHRGAGQHSVGPFGVSGTIGNMHRLVQRASLDLLGADGSWFSPISVECVPSHNTGKCTALVYGKMEDEVLHNEICNLLNQSAPKMMKEVKMMKEMAIQMAKELSRKMGSKLEMFKLRTSGVARVYWEDTALVHKNASIATKVYVVHATVQATMTALSKGDKETLLSLTTEAKELRTELTKNITALTSLCAEVQAFKTLLSSRRSNVQEAKKTGVRKLLELPCCSPLLASQLPPRH